MIFQYIKLNSKDAEALRTEIRFAVASGYVDGLELIALGVDACLDEIEHKRVCRAITRTLAMLKREGRITFYLDREALSRSSTEAEFLINKYGEFLDLEAEGEKVFFVKIN